MKQPKLTPPKPSLAAVPADSARGFSIPKTLPVWIALVVTAAAITVTPVRNFDLWWHLSVGQHVVETGSLYETEQFTYPLAEEAIVHKWGWLSDVVLFFTHDTGGTFGLLALKGLLLAVILWRLYHIGTVLLERSPTAVCLLLLGALFVAAPRILVRPHMIQYTLAVFLLECLVAVKVGRSRKLLFAIPIIQLVAINASPSGLLGLALAGLFFFGEGLQSHRNKEWSLTKAFGLCFLACGVVTLFSPDGMKILNMLKEAAPGATPWHTSAAYTVGEWASPFHPVAAKSGSTILLVCMMILTGVILLNRIIEVPVTYHLLWIASGALALTAMRHSFNFATVGIVGAMAFLPGRNFSLKLSTAFVASAVIAGLGLAATSPHTVLNVTKEEIARGKSDFIHELEEATSIVLEKNPSPRVFNFMSAGGALTWFSGHEISNFIDGRLLRSQNLDEHNKIYFGTRSDRMKLMEKYDFDTLVLDKLQNRSDALRYPEHIVLEAMDETWRNRWEAVYNGDHVIVWIRRDVLEASSAEAPSENPESIKKS